MDIATLVIAVLGCISGFVSIAMQIQQHVLTGNRLQILNDFENYYFFRLPSEHSITNYQALVHIMLVNKSSTPVTVYNVELITNGTVNHAKPCCAKSVSFANDEIERNRKTRDFIDLTKTLPSQFTLQPFEAVETTFFFQFYPDVIEKVQNSKLILTSSKGKKSKELLMKFRELTTEQ